MRRAQLRTPGQPMKSSAGPEESRKTRGRPMWKTEFRRWWWGLPKSKWERRKST